MSPVTRKAATPQARAIQYFNFGNMEGYSSGQGMPEGDYAIAQVMVEMFAGTKQDGTKAGPERLGAVITFRPLGGGEDRDQFYSFGSNAHLSWEPDETGKRIRPVLGGPGTQPNRSTNWAMFMQSMFDAGMPQNVVSDDLSAIEGTWVHMQNVPEPAERKGFRAAATGEAAVEDKARTVAIVSEIKDDGKPWEGTGGVPEATAEADPAPKSAQPAATARTTRPPVAAKGAPAPSTSSQSPSNGAVDLESVASEAIYAVLQSNPKGLTKLQLRTGTFKAVSQSTGDNKIAQDVVNTYFKTDTALDSLLGPLSYTVEKDQIKPVG